VRNTLRIETTNEKGMTLGEFKDALEKAERYGVKDDDVLRVTTFMAFSEGAPVKRVYLPVDDDL
jgi:hypothetical protein